MRCIYCLEDKNEDAFTKAEHVIPQSFGLFQDNFTLNQPHNKAVCDDCNQYFGNTLEIALARDTIEGVSRFNHGIRKPSDFKSIGNKSRLKNKKVAEENILKGVHVYLGYSHRVNKVVPKTLPQVGFLNNLSSEYTFFLLDDIPDKEELERREFDTHNNVLAFGITFEIIQQILAEKGIFPKFRKEIPLPNNPKDKMQVEFNFMFDNTIHRAIAKISFNYLTYWLGAEFALQDVFNPIRNYIRNGVLRDIPFVKMKSEGIIKDESSKEIGRLAHVVILKWATTDTSLLAHVSLSNYFLYTIQLSTYFSGEKPILNRGHLFNLEDHRIYSLNI